MAVKETYFKGVDGGVENSRGILICHRHKMVTSADAPARAGRSVCACIAAVDAAAAEEV